MGLPRRVGRSLQLLNDRIDKGQVSPKVRLFHQLEVDRLEGCGTAGINAEGAHTHRGGRHGLRGAGAATRLRLAALLRRHQPSPQRAGRGNLFI